MKAVILAGGRGKRLMPRTEHTPKCLLPLGKYSALAMVLRKLMDSGIHDVICCVSHLGNSVEAFVNEYKHDFPKLAIQCVYDHECGGTAGPLRQLRDLPKTFLVLSADIVTDISLNTLIGAHSKSGAVMTVATTDVTTKIRYGFVETDSNEMLGAFTEKPTLRHRVAAGIYVCERSVLDYIGVSSRFDMPDLIDSLHSSGNPIKVYHSPGAYWIDIGTEEDYQKAAKDALQSMGSQSEVRSVAPDNCVASPWGETIPLSRPTIGELDKQAVTNVLKSGWLTQGPNVSAFEAEFCAFINRPYAIAVTNGSVALELAFSLANIQMGDEIIMPSINYVAAANAARRLGAIPVFADVFGSQDLSVDPTSVSQCVSTRTRAICVLNYAGFSAPVEAIRPIADRCGAIIVEDCAHSLGGERNERGSLADVSIFSFFSNKNLTTCEGGMVALSREDWRDQLLLRRINGMTTDSWTRHQSGNPLYDVTTVGTNARLDEMRAALGRAQLQRLPQFIMRRRDLVLHYRHRLKTLEELVIPFDDKQVDAAAHHIFVVVLPAFCNRTSVIQELALAGIQTSVHYTPIHQLSAHRQPGLNLARTDAIASSLLTLPLFPQMSYNDVERVCAALRSAITSSAT